MARGHAGALPRDGLLLGRRGDLLAPAGRRHHERRLHGRLHAQPHVRGGLLRAHRPDRDDDGRVRPGGHRPTYDILKEFWENHDPTQGYRQGNDHGTQYRSAVYYTTDEQRDLIERTRDAYAEVIAARGYPDITTEIGPADAQTYYLAEDYHQQYLYKNPNGYRCHANTGLTLPPL